jgi:hypothetical protein
MIPGPSPEVGSLHEANGHAQAVAAQAQLATEPQPPGQGTQWVTAGAVGVCRHRAPGPQAAQAGTERHCSASTHSP